MSEQHEVALIIIGDEILRGQVQDANTIYLAKRLQPLGIKIRKVVVIPDEVETISKEVLEASKSYPTVFTAGGVGPTHDDVTYEGVAKALGLNLQESQELLERLMKDYPEKAEARRLAFVPTPCELIYVPRAHRDGEYAVVKAGNVYVLPGSPSYFRPAVDAIVPRLPAGAALHSDELELSLHEFELVAVLDSAVQRWAGRVAFGSYPQHGPEPRTLLSLEGRSKQDVEEAKRSILERLQFTEGQARRVYESRTELEHVARAFAILEECYNRYEPNQVLVCFNGGKDCTVVLHLMATLAKLREFDPPVCLYISGNAFPEVEEFVRKATQYYGLKMIWKEGPIRESLCSLLGAGNDYKACLMGTRKADPGAQALEPFAPTDPGWPELMRVSPIIDWSYSQVWQFLLRHEVPYCSLYDQGYTSLGAKDCTTKNPLLREPTDPSKYLPAHTLADDSTERHGRE